MQGQVGELLLFTMCSVTGVALVCSTGSSSNVSCLRIWASCFQITPGLVLLVVDWVVSAWFLWNTHIFRSPWSRWKCSLWDTHACALSTEEISTSQVLLLLPTMPPVSFWGNLTDIYLGTIRRSNGRKFPKSCKNVIDSPGRKSSNAVNTLLKLLFFFFFCHCVLKSWQKAWEKNFLVNVFTTISKRVWLINTKSAFFPLEQLFIPAGVFWVNKIKVWKTSGSKTNRSGTDRALKGAPQFRGILELTSGHFCAAQGLYGWKRTYKAVP